MYALPVKRLICTVVDLQRDYGFLRGILHSRRARTELGKMKHPFQANIFKIVSRICKGDINDVQITPHGYTQKFMTIFHIHTCRLVLYIIVRIKGKIDKSLTIVIIDTCLKVGFRFSGGGWPCSNFSCQIIKNQQPTVQNKRVKANILSMLYSVFKFNALFCRTAILIHESGKIGKASIPKLTFVILYPCNCHFWLHSYSLTHQTGFTFSASSMDDDFE